MFLQFSLKFYSLHDNKAHCKQLLHSLKEEQRILLHSFSECNIVFLLCIYLHFLLYCRLFTKILVVHSSLKYMDHILFQMFLIRCYQLNLLFGNLSIIYFPPLFFFFCETSRDKYHLTVILQTVSFYSLLLQRCVPMQPPKEIYIRYNRNPAGSSNLSVSSLLDSCHLLYQSGFAHNFSVVNKKL